LINTKKQHATSQDGTLYNFTSGWIESKGHRYQKYGRFEVRAKLPSGAAGREGKWADAWPAHWMMPEPSTSIPPNVCWPVGGEIDIMEGYRPRAGAGAGAGNGDVLVQHAGAGGGDVEESVLFTYHWAQECNKDLYDGNNERWPLQNQTLPVDWSQQFHTFGVEWDAARISWFVDGTVLVFRQKFGLENAISLTPACLKLLHAFDPMPCLLGVLPILIMNSITNLELFHNAIQ
jgi:beta-glucanase (GH16 family)